LFCLQQTGRKTELQGKPIKVAIVGRPNVGKSSFLNAVIGTPRVIVTDVAGTTHDVVDYHLSWREHDEELPPTATLKSPEKGKEGTKEIVGESGEGGSKEDSKALQEIGVETKGDAAEAEGGEGETIDLTKFLKVKIPERTKKKGEGKKQNTADVKGTNLILVDTAGIRRRGQHKKGKKRSN